MMNEIDIVNQILSGNSDAYKELVERYQTGVIIHCENITKSRQDGEDLAQEAFIKAYGQLSSFKDGKGHFSTWLYRIATNLCIDFLRKNNKTKKNINIDDVTVSTEPTHLEDDQKSFIQKAINELEPPKYGEIIKAYFWEGKSYLEIASEYKTSTGTIGTWVSRAKLQLKEKLS
jgi:RNA polymerase sigma-70 factor (ECF subfamily)